MLVAPDGEARQAELKRKQVETLFPCYADAVALQHAADSAEGAEIFEAVERAQPQQGRRLGRPGTRPGSAC